VGQGSRRGELCNQEKVTIEKDAFIMEVAHTQRGSGKTGGPRQFGEKLPAKKEKKKKENPPRRAGG